MNPDEFKWQPTFYRWLVATLVMFLVGGFISVRMGYPAYLGEARLWFLRG